MQLRQYQKDVQGQVFHFWQKGKRHVMPVLPTGAGKTAIMADTARYKKPGTIGLAIAHRSELVQQISVALGKAGLVHDIIGQRKTIKAVCEAHTRNLKGRIMFNPTAEWKVASVDTLNNMDPAWRQNVSMAFMDEAHHIAGGNKWHKCVSGFENALWMLPTATPLRSDNKGLGSHASGVVDALVEGPDLSWMIDQGFLTDFVVRTFKTDDLDMSGVDIGADGDYVKGQVVERTKKSRMLVGNVVEKYIEETPGKLAIVFAVDREDAQRITDKFNERGVPAEFIHGDSDPEVRNKALRRYENRETLVLVNVDLFGEGFDLPAIEVCIFARPTASYALYVQQWGRVLRLMISEILQGAWDTYTKEQRKQFIKESGKPFGIIHDHVGNMWHFNGPPTIKREWSLDDGFGKRNAVPGQILMRKCLEKTCQETYERWQPKCPWCGTEPAPPKAPSRPGEVAGDKSPPPRHMLHAMFGVSTVEDAIAKASAPPPPPPVNLPEGIRRKAYQASCDKILAQNALREIMGLALPGGMMDRVAQRRFFANYGVDVVSALGLGKKEAEELRKMIETKLRSV